MPRKVRYKQGITVPLISQVVSHHLFGLKNYSIGRNSCLVLKPTKLLVVDEAMGPREEFIVTILLTQCNSQLHSSPILYSQIVYISGFIKNTSFCIKAHHRNPYLVNMWRIFTQSPYIGISITQTMTQKISQRMWLNHLQNPKNQDHENFTP